MTLSLTIENVTPHRDVRWVTFLAGRSNSKGTGEGEGTRLEGRDPVQEKLAIFARLEKEFCDLIEAYEILLVERMHFEEIIIGNSQLESIDDLELVGQYFRAIHDTAQVISTF